MSRKVAIVGYGMPIKCGKHPETSKIDLTLETIKSAIDKTGISNEDIDGLTAPSSFSFFNTNVGLQMSLICEYLRISPKSMAEITCGGLGGALAFKHAVNEISLGYCDIAIVYAVEKQELSLYNMIGQEAISDFFYHGMDCFDPISTQPYIPFTVPFISIYALSAKRYLHEFGATEEHFAMAAVRDRKTAIHNPYAAYHDPLTIEEVLNSREICTPLKLLDCASSLEGAAAIVLANEEKARQITDAPIYIEAIGEFHDSSTFIPTDQNKSITKFIGVRKSSEEAFKRAKLEPNDIDVADIYAPFSSHELMIPEDLGFFKKGEMVKAIEDGSTEIGGKIPINTDGGCLSRGHPPMVTPLYTIIALIKQLRGEAGKMQVDGAELGLSYSEGGLVNNCMVIILRGGK